MAAKSGDRRPDTIQAALGFQLMLCRKNAGYSTQVAFAEALGMSDSPIAKAESGYQPPSQEVFKMWMDVCGVKGQLALSIEGMYHLARMRDDPQAYQASSWEETETEAHTLSYWEPTLVPGLAQTEDYARSLFTIWRHPPEKVEELTARRLNRQAILTGSGAPDVVMVIWERVLSTLVGSPAIMAAQLQFLLELSELPNVYVHVVPARLKAGMGVAGPASVAVTDAGEAVTMEAASESEVTRVASQVAVARAIFNNVRASAESDESSRTIITEAIETWKTLAGESRPTPGTLPGTASS